MLCVTDSKYDFAGSSLRRRETVRPTSSSPADTLDVRHRYDHRGRLLHTETLLNGRDTVPVWHEYDAVGRLAATTLGDGPGAQRTEYDYNLRGWLVRLQGREFTESLTYENPALPETVPSYSGNISEWSWQGGAEDDTKSYSFAYDGLSRLTSSSLFENGRQTDRFVERGISYDRNGNIKTLVRTADGTTCDSLTCYYSGNKLHSFEYAPIFDIEEVHPGGSIEFPPVEGTDPDDLKDIEQLLSPCYHYDPNGNMTRDYRHGLDLTYNRLNLVEKVTREGTTLANYSYLADGTKLSATDGAGDGLVYAGSLVYRKQGDRLSLESAAFNGGRFVATNNGMEARYFLTDHLGSVRAVVNSSGEVLERNDYYPYGMRWEDPESQISDNRFGFNGKERQDFIGLPYIDYGARQYDPNYRLTWNGLDQLAEKYLSISPFAFCGGNPVVRVDSDGQKWVNANGALVWANGGWTRYATAYDKVLGNELQNTPTGKQQFEYLVNGPAPTRILYEKLDDHVFGKTTRSKLYNGVELMSISLDMSNMVEKARNNKIGVNQAAAATLGHEITHTKPKNIKMQDETEERKEAGEEIDYENMPEEIDAKGVSDQIIYEYQNNIQPTHETNNLWNSIRNFFRGLF